MTGQPNPEKFLNPLGVKVLHAVLAGRQTAHEIHGQLASSHVRERTIARCLKSLRRVHLLRTIWSKPTRYEITPLGRDVLARHSVKARALAGEAGHGS